MCGGGRIGVIQGRDEDAPTMTPEKKLPVTDRAKSEAKYGGHGGSKLRRFQSPCAIFTIRVNMKDRVGRLRRR